MAKKKQRGRPKFDSATRGRRVVIYLTEADAEYLTEIAESMEFKGRSEFIVAIIERLIIGGFSVMGFIKLAFLLQRRGDQTGTFRKNRGAYWGIKRLPALPRGKKARPHSPLDKETITKDQVAQLRPAIKELEKEAA